MWLYIVALVIIVNFLISLVAFINDEVNARKHGQKRNVTITTWFCVSLTVLLIAVGLVVLFIMLITAFFASM